LATSTVAMEAACVEPPPIHLTPDEESSHIRKRREAVLGDTSVSKKPRENSQDNNYNKSDIGPFTVHVQKISGDDKSSIIHPIHFGNFLSRNNIKNISSGGVKSLGKFKISVEFKDFKSANSFCTSTSLQKLYTAVIPTYQITRMGIIKGIPTDLTDSEIIEEISIPEYFGKILKVRRLNYKDTKTGVTQWLPSQSIVVTFQGQRLPKNVYLHYNSLPVEQYIFPTIQCFRCCRFGHTKTVCRSTPRCFKCSEEHLGEECLKTNSICINCSGSHNATNFNCPEYIRQKNIKHLMASQNVSYFEASKKCSPAKSSFAEVTSLPSPSYYPGPITQTFSVPENHVSPPKPSSYKKTSFKFRTPKANQPSNLARDQPLLSSILLRPNGNSSESSDGFAFPNNSFISENKNTNSDLIQSLLTLLINIISQNKIPSNAAELISNISSSISNNGYNSSMEQPKRYFQ
jgi:hypothetical protein